MRQTAAPGSSLRDIWKFQARLRPKGRDVGAQPQQTQGNALRGPRSSSDNCACTSTILHEHKHMHSCQVNLDLDSGSNQQRSSRTRQQQWPGSPAMAEGTASWISACWIPAARAARLALEAADSASIFAYTSNSNVSGLSWPHLAEWVTDAMASHGMAAICTCMDGLNMTPQDLPCTLHHGDTHDWPA